MVKSEPTLEEIVSKIIEAVAGKWVVIWEGEAHRALADTLACCAVWHYLDEKENIMPQI